MKLTLTPEEDALRAEVRAFLRAECPAPEDVPRTFDERIAFLRRWQGRCYDAGYVGRSWPTTFGGGGGTVSEQLIIDQELAAAGAPEFIGIVGLDVLGPSLLAFGDDAQRRRYVPSILSAHEIWCQGFSEPDAGSDLASLRTRAVEHDDHFVVNGQKTWISWGQFARWCGVLVRTSDEGPKHRGISMLLIDMESPGVEVRPMEQPTGHAEFCELFLDDVVVPKENLLGERGQGWAIAMYTLGHERGTAALPRQVKLRSWLDRLVADVRARELDGRPIADDERAQTQLAQAMIGIEVLRHHAYRAVGTFVSGGAVGAEGSTVKLLMAEAEQRLASTAIELLAPALLSAEPAAAASDDFWHETYLYSRAATIYGGTQQIQRGIVSDRILRLPRE